MELEKPKKSKRYSKPFLLTLFALLLISVIWTLLTWDCVKNRSEGGIKINLREIIDCSY